MAARPETEYDDQTRVMLFEGASISQLATIFKMDNRTVTKRIYGLKPCAKRQGHGVYSIAEAAPYLVDPIGDIEAHIKKMNHRDLPPILLKEFWNGQNARLKFEKDQGLHWPTDQVMDHYAKVFQTFRTNILLAVDLVEREAEMTERQRNACKRVFDQLMADVRRELIEKFSNEPKRNFEAPESEGPSDVDFTETLHAGRRGASEEGVGSRQGEEGERDDAGRDPDDPAYGL